MNFETFKTKLDAILDKEHGCIAENLGDVYYYEHWSIERLDNGNLEVGFDIGSGSGWIPTDLEYKELSYEELFTIFENQADLGEFDALSILIGSYDDLGGEIVRSETEEH
jgi:hypothetical protein